MVLVATWFPPLKSVAVNRMVAFAKYLDHSNFNVIIITLSPDDKMHIQQEFGCEIYRIPNKTFFNLPDFTTPTNKVVHYFKVVKKLLVLKLQKNEFKNWSNAVLKKLKEIDDKLKIDFLISSFAPAAPIEVCSKFKDKNSHTKWIVDMRDEMSQNPSNSEFLKKYYINLEQEINKKATALTSVSMPIVNYFKELMPNLKHFEEIRNGFDGVPPLNKQPNKKFTITYAGSFYGSRKPNTFFKAVENLIELNLIEKSKFAIQFIGTAKNFNVPSELEDIILFTERVTQDKSMEFIAHSDVNLLIQPSWGRKGVFTGKIFDYIAVKKPILGILDTSDVAAKLIIEENFGEVAEFNDITGIEKSILKLYNKWINNQLFMDKDVSKFHRKVQVEKLNILLNKLSNE